MKITDSHPAYLDFLKNEMKTLTYIYNWGLVRFSTSLSKEIQLAGLDLKNKIDKELPYSFNFHASFQTEVQKYIHEIIIGVNLTPDFEESSYSFTILGSGENNKQVIRKFHFDYALVEPKQPAPLYHLQYGGELSPKMEKAGLDDDKLDGWLSVPRLVFHPMNIALLLDIVFCECRSIKTKEIVEGIQWRKLIYENEVFLINSYYTGIYNYLNSRQHTKKSLIRDFLYKR